MEIPQPLQEEIERISRSGWKVRLPKCGPPVFRGKQAAVWAGEDEKGSLVDWNDPRNGWRVYGNTKWHQKKVTVYNHPDRLDTLVHEVAHVLAGSHQNHGQAWERRYLSLAARCGIQPKT